VWALEMKSSCGATPLLRTGGSNSSLAFEEVAMNQPMKALMGFAWRKLFLLLGRPFTLQENSINENLKE